MRQRVVEGLPEGFDPKDHKKLQDIPKLILLADHRIIDAWRELEPVIEWNKNQPAENRLPAPYFARAQIWTAVGNHSDALGDFLKASSLVRSNKKPDLLEYARYFTFLESALDRESKLPGKPYIASARRYWGMGITEYRAGRLDKAIFHFTDAVRLNPSSPIYWYCRALCYKRLKLDEKAERDARIGVTLESQIMKKEGMLYSNFIDGDLENFQGSHRNWLSSLRRGDGIAWKRY